MNELIKVNMETETPTISGRELHEFLEVATAYKDWFPRMCEYGFVERIDFNPLKFEQVQIEGNREVKRDIIDHSLNLDMAKELCMIQRSEKGKIARKYFLEIEKRWNDPVITMARALKFADKRICELSTKIAADTPKVEYYNQLVDKNMLTSFRDTAKELGVKEKAFISYLLTRGFVYRDRKGKLKPYAQYSNLFSIKEYINDTTGRVGNQTFVTPKGREHLLELLDDPSVQHYLTCSTK